MKKFLLAVLFLAVVVVFADNNGSTKKVLLAIEKTDFKEKLAKELKLSLERDSVSVTLITHNDKGLIIEKPESYACIFISNSGVKAAVRPWIIEWINKNKELKEKVILHTTQKSTWEVSAGVDAVTSASKNSLIPELVKQYKEMILKK